MRVFRANELMRIVRFAAIGIIALFLWADSSALAVATWASRQVEVGVNERDGLFGVSCPKASACVGGRQSGRIVTSENPDGGASAWRSEVVKPEPYVGTAPGESDRTSPGSFESVSCPTTGMCAAVTYAGDFYASGDPGAAPRRGAGPISMETTPTLI